MMNLKDLRTENFILRELVDSDKKELFRLLQDPVIKKYIPGLSFSNLKEIEKLFILSKLDNSLIIIVEDIKSKKIIGMIFTYVDCSHSASISYVLHVNYRNKGIMREALKLFIKYLYSNKLAISANFYIDKSNKASLRIMNILNIPCYANNHYRLSLKEELPF